MIHRTPDPQDYGFQAGGTRKPQGYGSFRKLGGTLFWGPYHKDPTIWGAILGSPIFGNSHIPNLPKPTFCWQGLCKLHIRVESDILKQLRLWQFKVGILGLRVITYWLWQFKVGILGLRVLTYKKTKVMAVQGRDIRVESNNLQKKVRSWQFKVGILELRVITYKKSKVMAG